MEVENPMACVFCEECLRVTERFGQEEENVIKISTVKDKFIFSVECTGSLKPEEIVLNALEVLQTKVTDVKDVLRTQINLDSR